MTDEELATTDPSPLSCPFCGHQAYIGSPHRGKPAWYAQCSNRDCVMTEMTRTWPNRSEAIAAWNTRVNSDA